MAKSTSEETFGQKALKGWAMNSYIQPLAEYNSPNQLITKTNFPMFMSSVDKANDLAASNCEMLSESRALRVDIYHGPKGMIKLCSRIRDFVASMPSAKTTTYFKNIQKQCQKMRGYVKPTKKSQKALAAPPTPEQKREYSQFETSFGSIYRAGKDVLEIIKLIQGYDPSVDDLTPDKVDAFLQGVLAMDNSVANIYEEWVKAVEARYAMFEGKEGLRERMQMIKNYIGSIYDRSSNEYKNAVKIKY